MKAVQFVVSIPRYLLSKAVGPFYPPIFYSPLSCLRYVEVPEPRLPGPKWVKIKTRYGGICGSDLNLIRLHDSPALAPFGSSTFIMGHENVGTVVEVGAEVDDIAIGQRVIADPLLCCPVRGIDPPCPACQEGEFPRCQNFARGKLAPGVILGSCQDTGGSWSPYFVAHRHQLFPVPDNVSDEDALLVDPFADALHVVKRAYPEDKDTVLVIGAGVMGLGVIAALRALGTRARLLVLAKYRFQGELAKDYGADEVIYLRDGDYYTAVAEAVGGTLYTPPLGKRVMIGGADVVYECVGHDNSLDEALRFTRAGGRVAVLGLVTMTKKVDWTFLWFKELTVIGAHDTSMEDHHGERRRSYQLVLDWVANGRLKLAHLLTHTFALEDYKRAIEVTLGKATHKVVKSAFEFKT